MKKFRNHYGYLVDLSKTVSSFDDVGAEVFNPHNESVILIPKPKIKVENFEEQLKWAMLEKIPIAWCKPDDWAYLPKGAGNYDAYFRCGASPVNLIVNVGKKIGVGCKGTLDERRKCVAGIGHFCHRN